MRKLTKDDVDEFGKLEAHIEACKSEFSTLSKAKPDVPLNKFKIGIINQYLGRVNKLIGTKHYPIAGFEEFDEDSLPTNSDVVMVLTNYSAALETWRSANLKKELYSWKWNIEDADITTDLPARPR